MSDFDILWLVYAHAPNCRSKKALSRAIFEAITGPGRTTRVDGLTLTHQATPEVIIRAAKAMHMQIIASATPAEGENRAYVPGLQVWLNQGRFEDIDDQERDRLAGEYDDLQERMQERKHKLEIVR